MNGKPNSDEYVSLIIGIQSRLYAYIMSLVGNPESAGDVLQETSLVLWHKAGEFEEGTDFTAWAFSVAHFQVLAHRKRVQRERLKFDDELLQTLATEAASRLQNHNLCEIALADCLTKLTPHQRSLVEKRYQLGGTVQAIAAESQSNSNAVGQALHRARLALLACIQRKLAGGGAR